MGMIIANVFPKSGTGLIRQILEPFGKEHGHLKMFWGPTGERVPTAKTKMLMSHMRHEEGVMTAHLHWDVQFAELFRNNKMLFLIRDPRDVIVSHAHYVKNEPIHHLHKYYKNEPIQKCYMQSMYGLPNAVDGHGTTDPFPDIANRFLPYLGWAYMDNVLVIRYENLVENIGRQCRRIASFICPKPPPSADVFNELINEMVRSSTPETSNTFRSGRVGDWETAFDQVNKDQFDRDFSWLLELMGKL